MARPFPETRALELDQEHREDREVNCEYTEFRWLRDNRAEMTSRPWYIFWFGDSEKQSGSGVDLSLVLEISEDPGEDEIAQRRSRAGGIEGEQKGTLAQGSRVFV